MCNEVGCCIEMCDGVGDCCVVCGGCDFGFCVWVVVVV